MPLNFQKFENTDERNGAPRPVPLQAKPFHAGTGRVKQSKADWLWFLEETLIPDLHESGKDATAEDFERGVELIKDEATDKNFAEWLLDTLIPDLLESGYVETAKDFHDVAWYIMPKKATHKNPGVLVLEPDNIYKAKVFPAGLVREMSAAGPVDNAATRWVRSGKVKVTDLNAMRIYLLHQGAWKDSELEVYEDNLARLLWLAAGDIKEYGEWYFGE